LTVTGKVLVVAGATDLRPTWGDAPETVLVRALVNDKLVEGDAPWTALGKLQGLSTQQVQALLQGAAMLQGARDQIVTLAQAEKALANWPEALADVKAAPPGMRQAATGTWLRIYDQQHHSAGRAGGCSYLIRYAIRLDPAGTIAVHRAKVRASGSIAGSACTLD
jgi:hypothetical protein